MRSILLSYLSLFLFILALFLVLSFNAGFGYVFIQWHGWQVQTNLFLVLIAFLSILFLIYLLWMGVKKILRRYLQKYEIPKSFSELHPYEKLGVLWLLHAERIERENITLAYKESFLLYPLIQARTLLSQQDTMSAKQYLKDQNTPLFELSELLKIDIALLEKNYADALNRLEFLSVQPLSSWLKPIKEAYLNQLQEKWFEFAQQCPWWIFKTNYEIKLDASQTSQWIQALLNNSIETSEEDQTLLFDWYQNNKINIETYYVEDQIHLLKLMSKYKIFDQESFLLAENILKYRFNPEVLYIWLDKGLIHIDDLSILEKDINDWIQQYPAQPSLTFAQWHILQKLKRIDEANALLALYPHDPYMAYLRLNQALTMSTYKEDLKLLMRYSGQNFKFDL